MGKNRIQWKNKEKEDEKRKNIRKRATLISLRIKLPRLNSALAEFTMVKNYLKSLGD